LGDPDYLAEKFVGWGPRLNTLVHFPVLRGVFERIADRVLPGGRWYEVGRTTVMDEVLQNCINEGAEQLVILGAGFDTRPYRFRDRLGGVRVFEVDHPITSQLKRERVRKLFGELPAHVSYVEIDFETESLADKLASAGYLDGERSIFIWSGVTPYITEEAVAATLRFVAERSGAGSTIVFDYIFREFLDGDDGYYGAANLRKGVARQGEPFRFGVPEGEIEAFVNEHGLEVARSLTAGDFELGGRTYECGGICVARRGESANRPG
jgi:methyltransferase (TIGR00027 family)